MKLCLLLSLLHCGFWSLQPHFLSDHIIVTFIDNISIHSPKVVFLIITSFLIIASPWLIVLSSSALAIIYIDKLLKERQCVIVVKTLWCCIQTVWVQITAPPLVSCVNLGKTLNFNKPQIYHLWNGANNIIPIL